MVVSSALRTGRPLPPRRFRMRNTYSTLFGCNNRISVRFCNFRVDSVELWYVTVHIFKISSRNVITLFWRLFRKPLVINLCCSAYRLYHKGMYNSAKNELIADQCYSEILRSIISCNIKLAHFSLGEYVKDVPQLASSIGFIKTHTQRRVVLRPLSCGSGTTTWITRYKTINFILIVATVRQREMQSPDLRFVSKSLLYS
jgi:hypothetical protein